MSRIPAGVLGIAAAALAGCQKADPPAVANKSEFTSLSPDKCQPTPDGGGKLLCSGVGGYRLAVSGGGVELIAPSGEVSPLGPLAPTPRQAEWRMAAEAPVALILGGTPTTIAKVSPAGACVTARLAEADATIATVHGTADAAPASPCLPPQ